MNHPVSHLEARVRRLERMNLLLLLTLALIGAPLLIGATGATAGQPETVQARRFQLVDDQGRVRVDLRHDASETGMFVLDADGDTRLGAAHFAHGGTGYALHGAGGRGAAVLYLKGDGTLTMYDDDGGVTARFPGDSP